MQQSTNLKISLGCDPELFVYKDGNPISCHELIPGTKEAPYKLTQGAVQRDGAALEFNIDPAYTPEQFTDNILRTLYDIRSMVPAEYEFRFKPAVTFEPWYFDLLPERVKELGCNPDFNAYSMLINPPPDTRPHPYLRTASGHIHVGWGVSVAKDDPDHFFACCAAVTELDNAYATIKHRIDSDTTRQSLYGKLGAFRPTTFGVEHRVPSCAWVEYPRLYGYMFDLYTTAMSRLQGENIPYPVLKDWHLEQKWAN